MPTTGSSLAPLSLEIMRVCRDAGTPLSIEEIVVHVAAPSTCASVRSLIYSLARYGRAIAAGQVAGSRTKLWALTQKGLTDLHEAEEIAERCSERQRHVALSRALGVPLRVSPRVIETARRVDRGMDREPKRRAA
jgi:hypothetical protein